MKYDVEIREVGTDNKGAIVLKGQEAKSKYEACADGIDWYRLVFSGVENIQLTAVARIVR